ncbi:cobyric acid synthase CobQ [Methylocystis bryophila]|uniref:Cobyric acid synthase n=2 Tax=Methylocystis bryophila TaxID=655015 RepID=A0A1W6N0F1_9HYPH|nr:cobyric acid synthase CobQ [Methylocystis bryophila]
MIQGTGSDVGKSLVVAGLARAFANRGVRVAPFKPQNMSNNAAVAGFGEIGRAQALQARAARLSPHVDMNPVLLKPQSGTGAQIVAQGQVVGQASAREYQLWKPRLMPLVLESFARLSQSVDLMLIEGAGSAAEINLRAADIANMGFARSVDCPVVLVGDIDRGGVIAQLVGCRTILDPEDASLIAGFIVNKFRGDPTLFDEGLRLIEERTGWPSLGLLPFFPPAARLPAEDSLSLPRGDAVDGAGGEIEIAVPIPPNIANFDDLDPLKAEPGVRVTFVSRGTPLPATAKLIVLPGSKASLADLAAYRAEGWDIDICAHVRRGGRVLGLCGGYQILGRRIADPLGVEGSPGAAEGLGLLDVETVMGEEKTLQAVRGESVAEGAPFEGYEMHMGATEGPDRDRPLLRFFDGRSEGAVSPDRRVCGTYVHGLFSNDAQRAALLAPLGGAPSQLRYETMVEQTLDALADHCARHLDLDRLLEIAR